MGQQARNRRSVLAKIRGKTPKEPFTKNKITVDKTNLKHQIW